VIVLRGTGKKIGDKMSEIEVQKDDKIPIYTACHLIVPGIDPESSKPLFAISDFHVTYHYNPGDPCYPPDFQEGDWTQIKHVGLYDDGEILASRVYIRRANIMEGNDGGYITHQADRMVDNDYVNGVPLHITWSSGGLPPVETGTRLQKLFASSVEELDTYYMPFGTDGFYNNDMMEANSLDADNGADRRDYESRIKPIFELSHSMAIWKTFKASPK
jgi:hypothetical protein